MSIRMQEIDYLSTRARNTLRNLDITDLNQLRVKSKVQRKTYLLKQPNLASKTLEEIENALVGIRPPESVTIKATKKRWAKALDLRETGLTLREVGELTGHDREMVRQQIYRGIQQRAKDRGMMLSRSDVKEVMTDHNKVRQVAKIRRGRTLRSNHVSNLTIE